MTKKNVPVLIITFCLLFLAAWLPRMAGLEQLVTVDEPKWLTRSANFYQAIANGQANDTYQSEHPGVTIMWAGTLGFLQQYPAYAKDVPGQFTWETPELERWLAAENGPTPLELLQAARWWIVFAISAVIALGLFPLRTLFGLWPAILITLFVAWDPFYIALSRQLHPDGLLTSFIYLSLLLFLAWLYGDPQRLRTIILSGVVMGLAWLTKTPSILLTVTIGLLAAFELLRRGWGRKRFVLEITAWISAAVVTCLLLWPVLWMGPLNAGAQVAEAMQGYIRGHENPTFFLGQVTHDPGALFYPIALALRSTPLSIIGLLLSALLALRFVWPFTHQRTRWATAGLLLFAVVYGVGMSLGNKQFDRYMLPAFVVLDVIAALGLMGAVQAGVEWLKRKPISVDDASSMALPARLTIAITLTLIVLAHAFPGFRQAPYYLTYYNPLFGGIRTAEKILMVGWGEGLKEAADWINEQSDADSANIVSWYRDGSLSYYLDSQRPVLDYGQIEFWADADYAVVYVNQRQRRLPTPRILDTIEAGEPVYVVERGGVELVRVYDRHDIEPPDWSGISDTSAANFDGGIELIGHSLGDQTYLAGDSLIVRLYLRLLDPAGSTQTRIARLTDADGNEIWSDERSVEEIFAGAANQEIIYDHLEIQLPESVADRQDQLTVDFYDPNGGEPTGVEEAHFVTAIEVRNAVESSVDADWEILQITALCHEPTLERGEPFVVCFYADGLVDGSLKASMRLIDPGGTTMAQIDAPIQAETQVELTLPDNADVGEYTLAIVVYDADTLESYPDQHGEHITSLSTLDVR